MLVVLPVNTWQRRVSEMVCSFRASWVMDTGSNTSLILTDARRWWLKVIINHGQHWLMTMTNHDWYILNLWMTMLHKIPKCDHDYHAICFEHRPIQGLRSTLPHSWSTMLQRNIWTWLHPWSIANIIDAGVYNIDINRYVDLWVYVYLCIHTETCRQAFDHHSPWMKSPLLSRWSLLHPKWKVTARSASFRLHRRGPPLRKRNRRGPRCRVHGLANCPWKPWGGPVRRSVKWRTVR